MCLKRGGRQRYAVVLLAVALLSCDGVSNALGTDRLLEDATSQLALRDRGELLSKSLMLFYRNFGDPRLDDLLSAVWKLDQARYRDLSWDLLSEPEYRINFAQLWAQWKRKRGAPHKELQEIREYVEPFLSGANVARKAAAVNFLGAIGGDADIPLLTDLALEQDRNVAVNSVIAIGKIGGPSSSPALKFLRERVTDPVVRHQIGITPVNVPRGTP
jgi:hypothetical protein